MREKQTGTKHVVGLAAVHPELEAERKSSHEEAWQFYCKIMPILEFEMSTKLMKMFDNYRTSICLMLLIVLITLFFLNPWLLKISFDATDIKRRGNVTIFLSLR